MPETVLGLYGSLLFVVLMSDYNLHQPCGLYPLTAFIMRLEIKAATLILKSPSNTPII